jgi:ribosomal protein L11 methylase PrmA
LHSVLFAPAAEEVDFLVAELHDRGTAGIIEEGSRIRAFFEDDCDYSDLLRTYSVLEMRLESTAAATAAPSSDCDPILAGQQFFIVPPLSSHPTPPGRHRLTINDTAAFGTGRHETTQIMLAALEQCLRSGETVLDVGSGTGILSMAARLLGAKDVWSCDINEDAVIGAYRHFRLSGFVGSADSVRDCLADLVLANISARILDNIAYDLKRVTAPGGRLLISGFLRGSEPVRYKPEGEWEQDGWLCWLCRPETINARGREDQINVHPQQWW